MKKKEFWVELMLGKIDRASSFTLKEIMTIAGPKMLTMIKNRLGKQGIAAWAVESLKNLHVLNELSKEGHSAAIAGHSKTPELFSFSPAEAVTLSSFGFDHVQQLFKKHEFNQTICFDENADFPERLIQEFPNIVSKCKILRSILKTGAFQKNTVIISFAKGALERIKGSKLVRKLQMDNIGDQFRMPPSYQTRIRDGFPVPSVKDYMLGHVNLHKMDIPTSTLSNSFNILNRTLWTNNKSYLSGKSNSNRCSLCGANEHTAHLVFECPELAEIYWEILSKAISNYYSKRLECTAFNVIYNIEIQNIPKEEAIMINILIQECKRVLIKKRYDREINPRLREIIYDYHRVKIHLYNILVKIESLFQYKGKYKYSKYYSLLQDEIMNVIL